MSRVSRRLAVETLHAILKEEPPPLPDRDGRIPTELGHVIRHCLEKDPDARFQSARDLAFVLEIAFRSAERRDSGARPERGLIASLLGLLF